MLSQETKRLKFTIIIGTNDAKKAQIDAIIKKLTHFYGGITYSEKVGTWSDTAVASKKWYDSDYMTERAYTFEIVTDDLSVENNMRKIKSIIAPTCKKIANWIHTDVQLIDSLHWSIENYLASEESENLLTSDDRILV